MSTLRWLGRALCNTNSYCVVSLPKTPALQPQLSRKLRPRVKEYKEMAGAVLIRKYQLVWFPMPSNGNVNIAQNGKEQPSSQPRTMAWNERL